MAGCEVSWHPYNNSRATQELVRFDGVDGDWFPIRKGLKQGCGMSPSRFDMYKDAMMRKVTEDGAGRVKVGKGRMVDLDALSPALLPPMNDDNCAS